MGRSSARDTVYRSEGAKRLAPAILSWHVRRRRHRGAGERSQLRQEGADHHARNAILELFTAILGHLVVSFFENRPLTGPQVERDL